MRKLRDDAATDRGIQHFHHLDSVTRDRLFLVPPQRLPPGTDRELMATALGATLYIPAVWKNLATTVARRAREGICSIVIDLEDAIDERDIEIATLNAIDALNQLAVTGAAQGAMLFLRVRSVDCIDRIINGINNSADALAGFVVPKFGAVTGGQYLRNVEAAGEHLGRRLYCMPVLESTRILHRESRQEELGEIARVLASHRETVLAVRIGATDMCGVMGIRRDRDHTIYDVRVVADAIGDIVNWLGRSDGTGFVITGPVWEYFADHERLFRPFLRISPFADHDAVRFRSDLVGRDLDGLLREISLDQANGLIGKTVIHPSHAPVVHALSVVTHEEYRDAAEIAGTASRGVQRSLYRNKMNEPRPHMTWAKKTLRRAQVFGVASEGLTFVDLLTALARS